MRINNEQYQDWKKIKATHVQQNSCALLQRVALDEPSPQEHWKLATWHYVHLATHRAVPKSTCRCVLSLLVFLLRYTTRVSAQLPGQRLPLLPSDQAKPLHSRDVVIVLTVIIIITL